MRFGRYDVQSVLFSTFRLDGGAMFGSVPKNLWSKLVKVDAENCIPMAARGLLVKGEGKTILVDLGMGDKWDTKRTAIFQIQNMEASVLPFNPVAVTDIVLTHLHFDHAGGISRWRAGSTTEAELSFPGAHVFLQTANFDNAQSPSRREHASYLPENVAVLKSAHLKLVDGTQEVLPDIWVNRVDGHTVGLQWVDIRAGSESILFPSDLIPTSHHLPTPYTMGYDICAATGMKEREKFLEYALTRNAVVVFEHDFDIAGARLTKGPKGYCVVKEIVQI